MVRLGISVVIPAYNGERFLTQTLESVARQTALLDGSVDIEVIVVDDGSSDATRSIAASHPVVSKVIEQHRLGVAIARNVGAAAATNEWLTFLDQDDLWHESRIARISPLLMSGAEKLLVTTEHKFAHLNERESLLASEPHLAPLVDFWIAAEDEFALTYAPIGTDSDASTIEHFLVSDLMNRTISMSTSFFILKSHLRALGGWSPHAASIDDWWLMANAARLSPVARVAMPTLLYRLHARATSRETQFLYPYATSLLALKFGGLLQDASDALVSCASSGTAEHLLLEALRSPEFLRDWPRTRFLWHLAHLLWPGRQWLPVFTRAALRRVLYGMRRR